MSSYQIRAYRANQLTKTFDLSMPVVVGRRDIANNEPPSPALLPSSDIAKLIVADESVAEIPRIWFRVTCDDTNRISIENLHANIQVAINLSTFVATGERRSFDEELLVDLGRGYALRIAAVQPNTSTNESLRPLASRLSTARGSAPADQLMSIQNFQEREAVDVAKMLQLALGVVREAAGSDSFFQAAAAAAAQIVGLDRSAVLLRKELCGTAIASSVPSPFEGWMSIVEHIRNPDRRTSVGPLSRTVFQRTVESGATIIHDPSQADAFNSLQQAQSLLQVCYATAAPIMDHAQRVVGVLYGDRWTHGTGTAGGRITDLEATIIEVLASAIAGGIARQGEERRRTALSGFFSPRVADLLANHPEMMDGQDVEISILFCDIRGFSSVTEKLGPKKAIEWINDVMSELSQCVIDSDGVLVDYVGDELFAMWGAPGEQTDHAARAFATAQVMLTTIENLRTRWASILPSRFGAGIGINTGMARVGNVGSRQKFKYGALGSSVNVGSRLQSATKQLGVACLASGETIRQARPQGNIRRLARLGVQGIDQAVEVYEVVDRGNEAWQSIAKRYEYALVDFEAGRFSEATQRLGEILQTYPHDAPSKKLLSRAVYELDEPSLDFTGTWRLTQK